MKPARLYLTLAFLCFGAQLFAQKEFPVLEHAKTMSLGDRTGYTVTIADMNEKEIVKALKNWLTEKQKKASFEETGKHEILAKQIQLDEFSSEPIDIYFLFEEEKNVFHITGFFNVGGAFVSSSASSERSRVASDFMKKFGQRSEKLKIMASLETAQKDLENKQDEKSELEKENEQLQKTVDECNAKIEQAKKDMTENKKNQDAKSKEISTQQTAVETIQSELEEYKGL